MSNQLEALSLVIDTAWTHIMQQSVTRVPATADVSATVDYRRDRQRDIKIVERRSVISFGRSPSNGNLVRSICKIVNAHDGEQLNLTLRWERGEIVSARVEVIVIGKREPYRGGITQPTRQISLSSA